MAGHADGRVLYIEPARSRRWRGFVLVLHLLAVGAFLLADVPLWVRLPGILLTGLNLFWEFRHHFPLCQPRDIGALAVDGAGRWSLDTGQGQVPARLLPASRVWSQMLWLRFEAQGRRFWLLLPSDAVPADDFRHLQVRLRLADHVDRPPQSRRGI
jgi:hypothetical protein